MKIRVEEIESADEEAATKLRAGTTTRVIWWGSDCDRCGNTTPGSMRCDECNSSGETRPLWIEMPR